MDQDFHTCPSCGAPTPNNIPCPYCGWTSEHPSSSEVSSPSTDETELVNQDEDIAPAQLKDLMSQAGDPEHLLDQVPEEMRGVLTARLRALEESGSPSFSETTESTLREQGYVIDEDARGARISAAAGQSADLSASDVVKMASELDGGVQPQTKLPICGKCEAASPIGSDNCQWCGEPFE